MNTINNEALERQEIESLLPWHAAGTLNRRDAQRVEAALASDRELARQYELVREELAETILLNETLGAPSARAREKLFAVIDAESATTRRTSLLTDLGNRLTEYMSGFSTRTLAWSGAAAVLAIAIQAGLLATVFINERVEQRSYQTVSLEQRSRAAEGAFAVIRFAPQASVAEITNFLDAHKATVVDGPKPGGLYRIRVAEKGLPKDELAARIRRMQEGSKIVGFIAAVE
jgi:hypothetical protein